MGDGHVPGPLSARLAREEGSGVMDIPDEAWIAAHSVADADLDEVVRAVAPHIAGAAQVQILREMAVELRATSVDVTWSTDLADGLRWAAEDLQRKADELEAGAGQTGEGT